MDAFKLMKELKTNYEQEVYYLPKEAGLSLIESTTQDDSRISAKCRDAKVEDLWSLTSFFGYSAQTFVLAVNLLDRFLAMMRVRHTHTSDRQDPQNLSCVSLSCLHMAAKVTEEECNLTPTDELIRIGQCRFTVSDLGRMEKIIAEKLDFKSRAVTALTFLHLYHQIAQSHCTERTETLSLDKLEAQLKACLCRISFSKAKPSVLALSLLRQDIEAVCSEDLLEITCHIQRHLKDSLSGFGHVCPTTPPECIKPNHRRLQWVVSRRTAQNLHSYRMSLNYPPSQRAAGREREVRDKHTHKVKGYFIFFSSGKCDVRGRSCPFFKFVTGIFHKSHST
uniref:Cyclin G2 n=1 Tax=Sphaeramia orbicularis TaxID=375764 RepID=A0A672ZVA4_9TELE